MGTKTMTDKTPSEKLQEIGACAMSSIREMVAALECDYDRLEELRDERDAWEPEESDEPDDPAQDVVSTPDGTTPREQAWAEANPDDAEELKELEEAAGECESREDAEQRIQEDPLSIEVRSDWYSLGADDDDKKPGEFCILLSTGGPATRIIGELRDGEPHSARLEAQDWGTAWTAFVSDGSGRAALLTYARQFFFGE